MKFGSGIGASVRLRPVVYAAILTVSVSMVDGWESQLLAPGFKEGRGGFCMSDARCVCGAIALSLAGPPKLVGACHCVACQRRTGAPFGVGAFYPADAVTISGAAKEFARLGASGGTVRSYFCPDCG